jgi:hypothetical protein
MVPRLFRRGRSHASPRRGGHRRAARATAIATIQRSAALAAVDGFGLTLAESKDLLECLQATVVREHAAEFVAANSSCGGCAQPLARKGASSIVYRTAFGKLSLQSPRLYSQCRCGVRHCGGESFNPLALHLAQRTHPELLYLQARWASAMSYERATKLLGDVLPLGTAPGSSSIKAHVRAAEQALATEAEEHGEHFFAEQPLKFPDPPTGPAAHVLELDAAYVRAIPERYGGRSSFGIVTGRLIKPEVASGWHAYVIDETINPLTQLHGFLDRRGIPIDTPLAVITDGGAYVGTPTILSWRPVQVILDWFYISMRFEHVLQRLRGSAGSRRSRPPCCSDTRSRQSGGSGTDAPRAVSSGCGRSRPEAMAQCLRK